MIKVYCKKCNTEVKPDDRTGCFYDCPNCGELKSKDIIKKSKVEL